MGFIGGYRVEPAHGAWALVLGGGIGASTYLALKGYRTLSTVAHDHPLIVGYFAAHLFGVLPVWLDPLAGAHATLRRRRNGAQSARACLPAAR